MVLKTGLITCVLLAFATSARADFAGQTILGPLVPGSVVNGNTTNATDDNDGFTSGDHVFNIWPGHDDVWQLNWPGGDLTVTMTGGAADLDLFLYTPDSYNDSGNYSTGPTTNEQILAPLSDAGTYYIVVDSTGAVGPYSLQVNNVPEPTSLAAIALSAGLLIRRRR